MPREGLMTAVAAARYLSCSISTVRRMVGRSEIPHFRLGKLIRFRRSQIDAWLALHHKGDIPAEPARDMAPDPDQLSLFGRDIATG